MSVTIFPLPLNMHSIAAEALSLAMWGKGRFDTTSLLRSVKNFTTKSSGVNLIHRLMAYMSLRIQRSFAYRDATLSSVKYDALIDVGWEDRIFVFTWAIFSSYICSMSPSNIQCQVQSGPGVLYLGLESKPAYHHDSQLK